MYSRLKKLISRILNGPATSHVPSVVSAVSADALTFLETKALNEIYQTVQTCEQLGLVGDMIEAGCAAGGSAIVITAAKNKERKLRIYDVFATIPPPTDADGTDVKERYDVITSGKATGIGERGYYGYETDLQSKVVGNFARHNLPVDQNNVELVKGLFQDTLTAEGPVAFAHLDGDWYESVKVCLERIVPKLVAKGILIIDDYHAWSGCRKAVDEYFADKKDEFQFVRKARLHIIRN